MIPYDKTHIISYHNLSYHTTSYYIITYYIIISYNVFFRFVFFKRTVDLTIMNWQQMGLEIKLENSSPSQWPFTIFESEMQRWWKNVGRKGKTNHDRNIRIWTWHFVFKCQWRFQNCRGCNNNNKDVPQKKYIYVPT